jgi:hypothetical protein
MPFGEDPFIKPWMIERADDHYALDASRAKALLGWTSRRSLMQTLPKMIEALKKDPATFYRTNHLQGEPSPASAVANPVEDAAALPGAVS